MKKKTNKIVEKMNSNGRPIIKEIIVSNVDNGKAK